MKNKHTTWAVPLLALLVAANPFTHSASAQDIVSYAKMCAKHITAIPAFSCHDPKSVAIPITVNGKVPTSYAPNMSCDRPSLLPESKQQQCIPHTRVLNLSKGDNQIIAICRRYHIRSADSVLFDEINIISHSVANGSTCWFLAEGKNGKALDTTRVPPPSEKRPPHKKHIKASKFWSSPAKVVKKDCAGCHDNDPFMYSPYIGQVWDQVPTDPFGWYKNIGKDFKKWKKPVSLSTRNNTCVGCHRLGVQFTSSRGTKQVIGNIKIIGADNYAGQYPRSHFMPVGNFHSKAQWNTIYRQNAEKILACHKKQGDGCIIRPITGKPQ